MNKLVISAKETTKSGYGQLGVVCPISLPPYTYSLEFVDMLIENGVNILFIPFIVPQVRMPWMMGGTEQSVDVEGCKSGITPEMCFELTRIVREKYPNIPIVIVSFYNDVLAYGISRFAAKCAELKIDAIDTPGYSFVSNGDYSLYGKKLNDVDTFLIHPISTELAMAEKGTDEYGLLKELLNAGKGFIFLMADSGGKSGAVGTLPTEKLKDATKRIRDIQLEIKNVCPIITVCGIATPQNCNEAVNISNTDGVLMASAVIRRIQAGQSIKEIGEYIKTMKEGLRIQGNHYE